MDDARSIHEACLRIAWESAKDRMGVSEEDFLDLFDDWETVPVYVGGKLVGAVLMYGPEVHACITEAGHRRWFTKSIWNRTVGTRLSRYGHAISRAHTEVGQAFLTRLGFKQEGGLWVLKSQSASSASD